jgi:hypothetical protein
MPVARRATFPLAALLAAAFFLRAAEGPLINLREYTNCAEASRSAWRNGDAPMSAHSKSWSTD